MDTKRLQIREFALDDLDAFAHLMANNEVMRFSLSGPLDRKGSLEYLQKRILSHYQEHGFGLWALLYKKQIIGFAGLIEQTIDSQKEVEFGYRLHPDYWGKGFAVEAGRAICEYAFSHLSVNHLISIIDPKNHRSLKVATRVGMHHWKKTNYLGFDVEIYRLQKVTILPFSETWAYLFEEEKKKLERIFTSSQTTFFHIGSTSIPDCRAKPIIDILGVTVDITHIDAYHTAMESIGYTPMGEYGMLQRRFFLKRSDPPVNLHLFEESDPEVSRHLRFRNYMKKHPKQIANYSILKEKLSKKYPHDIENYVLGKAAFIKSIDVRAAYEETTPPILHKTPRRKSIWSEKEILHAMHANIHLQMSCFAKYLTTMELLFEPDATVVQSTVLDDTYNFVLNARFNEKNAKNRTRHILSLFASKKLPLSWWVGPLDRPDHLEEILLQEGLTFKEENIGMALYLNNKALPSSSTTIERVETKEQLMNFCDVITELGIPKECASEIYQKIPPFLYEQESSFEIHLRRENGKAVSTGILVLHANVAGIYYIITALKERKKGFGTDMMYHLLHRAKKRGYTLATLQASAMGKELYKKIGFQPLCSYKEYSNFYSD